MSALVRIIPVLGLLCACFAGAAGARSGPHARKPPPARDVLIRCGTLLAVPGRAPVKNVTLVVKNGVIEGTAPGFDGPDLNAARAAGAKVEEVDVREWFVLPGLIDCHVHLTHEVNPDSRLRAVEESDADSAIRSVANARRTLEAGFTTVRDLGGSGEAIIALRDGVQRGDVAGPRVLCAGKAVSITGGHADPTLGYREGLFPVPGVEEGIADGPDRCAQAVRYQVKRGVDCIKLTATGGVLSASTAGLAQHFTDAELAAIVSTAHTLGRKAAAHAHGTNGINAALRAGVDSIEHGTYLDDESVRLFREKGAYLVPTLLAGKTVMENAADPGYYLPMVARKAAEVGPRIRAAFRKAHEGGVKIAFGTDSGVSPHGQNAREFALMVDGGMTPSEAIIAATVSAADLLGLADRIGTLERGKAADVIAVRGDPLADVTELERVLFVMRDGTVYKPARGAR